ncbi:type I secretion system permease/ATPase [Roseibium sp. CAU 1637]|uniref:Type I secretion system permease/ATPase n=1 Tax=Roseibium limicola TaxID=2816037 RepID=A0A939J9W5_9HYPH|nr:type I secretion system permease/ATPase [Roseibium limicola]MBO0346806.1 type I secretion system permease/ATPase [Roseibium limicola]
MKKIQKSKLQTTLQLCRSNFLAVVFFSFFINMLMLIGPLYMLQVYDRVLASRSEVTLIMITGLALALLVVYWALEAIRSRLLVRTGAKFDHMLGRELFQTAFRGHMRNPNGAFSQPIRDLDTLREFLSGGGIIAFCDAPWVPVFLAACFMLHPYLGIVALIGAILIFTLAVTNELTTRNLLKEASGSTVVAHQYVSASMRNAETVHALGMMPGISKRWLNLHWAALGLQSKASDRAGLLLSGSKFVRMGLQIAILGVGAYLVLESQVTAGSMVAASIMMGRALAPVEMAVGQWKGLISARSSYDRLKALFLSVPDEVERMALPTPKGAITLEQVMVAPPGARKPTLRSVNMHVQPGELVGVIGPSGAGKSTLARTLVGIWPPLSGHVRIDGADVTHWDPALLGPHLGYLPQDVELFAGTVAENIGRFGDIDPEKVVDAAQRAGAHDMILQLPDGYGTRVGEGGRSLSGGQRQRIGLARALHGDPRVLVLDEPNSSLDSFGEEALSRAILQAKQDNRTVIVISHRTSLLNIVDKIAVLTDGILTAYGPRQAVLEHLAKEQQQRAQAGGAVTPLKPAART